MHNLRKDSHYQGDNQNIDLKFEQHEQNKSIMDKFEVNKEQDIDGSKSIGLGLEYKNQELKQINDGSLIIHFTEENKSSRQQEKKLLQRQKSKRVAKDDLLFEGLDSSNVNYDPYIFFIRVYLLNATMILLIFIIWSIGSLLKELFVNLKKLKFTNAIVILILYIIDIFMAISVLLMYPLACFPTPKHYAVEFQYWAISSLIFLQSYILLQSYMISFNSENCHYKFTWAMMKENMLNLGLGRCIAKLNQSQLNALNKNKSKEQKLKELKEELDSVIAKSLEEENIDKTLFFFTLDEDKGLINIRDLVNLKNVEDLIKKDKKYDVIKGNTKQKFYEPSQFVDVKTANQYNEILKLIHQQGFQGKRHIIENFLWPHYQYIKLKQNFSPFKLAMIIIFVIILKSAFPIYMMIISDHQDHNKPQILILINFIFMYLNMMLILMGLVINDDLKGKRYILNVLETLLIQRHRPVESNSAITSEGDEDTENPTNEVYKLDLACNLSLESWDNARRLTILLDKEKSNNYETTFSFLAIYFLYTYIILSQDFLGIDLFPSLKFFFKSPIQEYTMICDFLLVTLLFLTRVNEGSQFNETFKKVVETIKKIASIYKDKKSLFDFYFSDKILFGSDNEHQKSITQRIYCTAADKVIYALEENHLLDIDVNLFHRLCKYHSKQRIGQLCATMDKLESQIEFDSEHFCHKFLGMFVSNMDKLFSTVLILAYIFFHTKLKKYLKEHKKNKDDES